jgi:hypothetical protein
MMIVRVFITCLVTSMVLLGASAIASSDDFDTKKVKTGILPAGGFFSLYEVDCSGNVTAAIASLNGQSRWCSLQGGAMNCFSSSQLASINACMQDEVAAVDDILHRAGQHQ